jgi:hypothetical protein
MRNTAIALLVLVAAAGIDFRTAAGRAKCEKMKQPIEHR